MIRLEIVEKPYYMQQWNDEGKVLETRPQSWSCDSEEEKNKLNNDDECRAIYGTINTLDTLNCYSATGLLVYYYSKAGAWVEL